MGLVRTHDRHSTSGLGIIDFTETFTILTQFLPANVRKSPNSSSTMTCQGMGGAHLLFSFASQFFPLYGQSSSRPVFIHSKKLAVSPPRLPDPKTTKNICISSDIKTTSGDVKRNRTYAVDVISMSTAKRNLQYRWLWANLPKISRAFFARNDI